MKSKFTRTLCVLLLSLALSSGVDARPEDNQQAINIQADRASQQNLEDGARTEYFGNVVMSQGSLRVEADHIVIRSVQRQVKTLVATGNPAHFQQHSDPSHPPVKARANTIEYQIATETVVLSDDARIDQPEASFRGNRITYNVATEEVVAEDRVNMVFTPAIEQESTPQEQDEAPNGDTAGQ